MTNHAIQLSLYLLYCLASPNVIFLSFHCNQQLGFRVDANMISFISKWSVHDSVDLCSGSIQYVSICSATGRKTNIASNGCKFDNGVVKDDDDELDSSKSTRSTARKPSDSPNSRKGVRSFGGPSSSLVWTMDSKPLNTAFCKSCNKLLRWSSGPICFCSTYSWHMSRSIPPSLDSKQIKGVHCEIKWKGKGNTHNDWMKEAYLLQGIICFDNVNHGMEDPL